MLLCSSCCQPLESVESHRAFNRFILKGYRPSTGAFGCLKSLFYVHNETVNVYTHAIYLLVVLLAIPFIVTWPSNPVLWWMLLFNICGHAACMFGSVTYHLFNSLLQSATEYWTLLQFDVAGIWFANTMTTFSYIFLSFYCDDRLRHTSVAAFTVVALLTYLPTLRAKTAHTRTAVFALFAVTRFMVTVSRQLFSTGIGGTNYAWCYYVLADVWLVIGSIINATRYPEKKWPGCFDITFSSHQLFHVIVILALVSNMLAMSLDIDSASKAVCH